MTTRQQVGIGLIVTALIAALAISDFLPGWVMAIIILLAGIGFTYYIVLNQLRTEKIEDLSLLLETGKTIYNENSPLKILNEMIRSARYLTGAEWAGAFVPGFGPKGEASWAISELEDQEISKDVLKLINDWIVKYPQSLLTEAANANPDLQAVFADGKIKSLLAVPLKNHNQMIGVLCLGNKKGHTAFAPYDRQMGETVGDYASRSLINIAEQTDLHEIFITTLKSIARAIEAREEGFAGHAERVAAVSVLMGKKLGLTENDTQTLEYSALLHDAGKLAASLEKDNGPAQEDESRPADQHPVQGADIFPDNSFFTPIKEAILYHHERYNGSGFPEGREKTGIPFSARIIAVADFYDALTRLCPEEERLNHPQTIAVIKKATGTLFDPLVVVALEEVEEEVARFYQADGICL